MDQLPHAESPLEEMVAKSVLLRHDGFCPHCIYCGEGPGPCISPTTVADLPRLSGGPGK